MYNIRPYIIYDLDDSKCILQNGLSTVIITNNSVKNFLIDYEKNSSKIIDDSILEKYFLDKYSEAKFFLISNKIIAYNRQPTHPTFYNKIILLYNDTNFKNYFDATFQGANLPIKSIAIDEYLDFLDEFENSLCLIFLNPFSLTLLNDISNFIHQSSIYKLIFFYNHSIYISQYYKKQWCNPCLKCFFYSLETQLRGNISNNGYNFQTLIDLLYEKKLNFKSHAPLNPSDFIPVLYILSTELKDMHLKDENINKVYEVNLKTQQVKEDFCYHWEMCDCYD